MKMLKEKKLFMVLVLVAAIVFIGASFAAVTLRLTGTKTYSIVVGELKLVLDEANNNLNIGQNDAIPVADYQGLKQDGYSFTIKNQGGGDMNYYVYIEDTEDKTMSDEAIRYSLQKNGETVISASEFSELNNRLLDSGKINRKQDITYNLKFWIGVNATNEQVIGKTFSVRLKVVGEQIADLAYQDDSGAADPKLEGKLIPVTISDTGVVKKANIYEEWFDYDKSIWANAVIVNDEVYTEYNSAKPYTVIEEDDIESYFVWIPRYRYKIFDEGKYETILTEKGNAEQPIEIEFETKNNKPSTGSSEGTWLTHPAFTSFDTDGFWVGKFESGYKGATSTSGAEKNESDSTKLVIKPNVYSWRSIQVANAHLVSYNYQRALDSHMMKNTEWGAVAYLSHSKYGAKDEEGDIGVSLRINNNSAFITGYSATEEPIFSYNGGTSVDGNRFESIKSGSDGEYTVNYFNANSVLSSTTGNYSGIYDMSGGTWEQVMAVVEDASGNLFSGRHNVYNSGFQGLYSCPTCTSDSTSVDSSVTSNTTGIPFPEDKKYYDTYTNLSSIYNFSNRILGDATGEMGPFYSVTDLDGTSRVKSYWYNDRTSFVAKDSPWFLRGGHWNYGLDAGCFASGVTQGHALSVYGFRVVLTP